MTLMYSGEVLEVTSLILMFIFLKIIQHLCRGRLQTRDVWGGGPWMPVGVPHPLFHIVQYSEPRNSETYNTLTAFAFFQLTINPVSFVVS